MANRCSNCLVEAENVFQVVENRDYFACPNCQVDYAKNRNGIAFLLNEEVNISGAHPKMDNRIFVIKGIYIFEECESGRMCLLVDKETGRDTKSIYDVNWLTKINNN